MLKLLVISQETGPDYLADLVFQGLIGCDQVHIDTNYFADYLSSSFSDLQKIYGRGFTAFGNISDNYSQKIVRVCSANEIRASIVQRKYDLIIYLSIQRNSQHLSDCAQYYSNREIVVLDGEDNTDICTDLLDKVTYYKRELDLDDSRLHPISFRVPKIKISDGPYNKTCFVAPCDPRDRSSYVFYTEESYYEQYRRSYFAYTMKKGGWDCLRHYEIVMNGCLPVFLEVEKIPHRTLVDYPKQLQKEANSLFSEMLFSTINRYHFEAQYRRLVGEFNNWLRENGTVDAYLKIFLRNFLR